MEIRYKDKKIRDICENEKKAIKRYNKIIAEKIASKDVVLELPLFPIKKLYFFKLSISKDLIPL